MGRRLNVPCELVDQWERQYLDEGLSLYEIAAQGTGRAGETITPQAVRYHLKKKGVTLRPAPVGLQKGGKHEQRHPDGGGSLHG